MVKYNMASWFFTENNKQVYAIIKVNYVNLHEFKILYEISWIGTNYEDIKNIYDRNFKNVKEYILYKYNNQQKIISYLRHKYFGANVPSLINTCLQVIKKNNLSLPENIINSPRIPKFYVEKN